MRWQAAVLLTTLLLSSDPVKAVTVTRPLLGQRVTNAAFLNTKFCQTHGCKIGGMTIEGTGSGNAVGLNNRSTDILLGEGLFVRLLREPDTTLVSADLNSAVTGSHSLRWTEMADVAADFFALTLHRPVTSQSSEIQNCIKLFKEPDQSHGIRGFWEAKGVKTGACVIVNAGTAGGQKKFFTFIAQMP